MFQLMASDEDNQELIIDKIPTQEKINCPLCNEELQVSAQVRGNVSFDILKGGLVDFNKPTFLVGEIGEMILKCQYCQYQRPLDRDIHPHPMTIGITLKRDSQT